MLMRILVAATLLFLSACTTSVDYGKVPHSAYASDPRCNVASPSEAPVPDNALFVATTRLPDCRDTALKLTHFRSESVRYGRFGKPYETSKKGGGKQLSVDLAFQAEARWWAELETAARKSDGRVLVYVHGYRETFASTSRDTFQIARLTGFKGPVIQYSWPSQGDFIRYVVDETNMYWDERNFRRFLQKLATQKWTKEIVLVSHSLGARLVLPAVEFVDRESAIKDSSNISNIILASPDIDREDFERDITEEILAARRVNAERRITVYASRRDKALALSRGLHGYPRLGSPYCFDPFQAASLKARGLPERCYATKGSYDVAPEKSGLTIVDTTAISRGGSGHSDFINSALACTDFKAVAAGDRNGSSLRKPSHLPHVFLLENAGKPEKGADKAACMIERP